MHLRRHVSLPPCPCPPHPLAHVNTTPVRPCLFYREQADEDIYELEREEQAFRSRDEAVAVEMAETGASPDSLFPECCTTLLQVLGGVPTSPSPCLLLGAGRALLRTVSESRTEGRQLVEEDTVLEVGG